MVSWSSLHVQCIPYAWANRRTYRTIVFPPKPVFLSRPDQQDPPAVTCNAFGSYVLTKSNATGSNQQGQMCTFYTAYWDKKFAVNTASYDDAVAAKYTYSYSSFNGKKDAQPSCGVEYTSPSGTYIKGGSAP